VVDRSVSVPRDDLIDLERQNVRGHILQTDLLTNACTAWPRTTKFGMVTHMWEAYVFRSAMPLRLHKCVAWFVRDSWVSSYSSYLYTCEVMMFECETVLFSPVSLFVYLIYLDHYVTSANHEIHMLKLVNDSNKLNRGKSWTYNIFSVSILHLLLPHETWRSVKLKTFVRDNMHSKIFNFITSKHRIG